MFERTAFSDISWFGGVRVSGTTSSDGAYSTAAVGSSIYFG